MICFGINYSKMMLFISIILSTAIILVIQLHSSAPTDS